MNRLLLFIGFCASMNLVGQTDGFNLRLAHGLNTSYSSVWEQDSSFLVAGFSNDTLDGLMYVRLLVSTISSNGSIISHKYLGDIGKVLLFGSNANDRLDNNNMILAGRSFIDGVSIGLVFQLDNLGDTISSTNVSSPSYTGDPESFSNWMAPQSLSVSSENLFYLAAQIASEETGNDFAIFSLSSDGQENWSFVYATNLDIDHCNDIEAVDDGVWVSVSSVDLKTEWGDLQSFVKLNLEGEIVWQLELEQSNHDICVDMEIFEDGIVVISSYEDGTSFGTIPVIFKVDFEGEYMWSTTYSSLFEDSQSFKKLVKCADGSGLVAVGEVINTFPENPELNGNYDWSAVLAKYSNEGAEIWAREYFILQSVHDRHKVVDLKATSDGGYIFCGESTDLDSQNPNQIDPIQQGWVVKVDGCGCLVPGCDSSCTTKVDEESTFIDSEQQFVVGPVPADWFINVHVLNDNYLVSRRIEIHNIFGQKVLSYPTPAGQATYMIDTQSLSSGIYIVSMTEHGRVVQSEKVEVRKL
jgi:hypothetical protein